MLISTKLFCIPSCKIVLLYFKTCLLYLSILIIFCSVQSGRHTEMSYVSLRKDLSLAQLNVGLCVCVCVDIQYVTCSVS